ncbi:hypothetical protein HK100_007143, partial [Physocladia obscura]
MGCPAGIRINSTEISYIGTAINEEGQIVYCECIPQHKSTNRIKDPNNPFTSYETPPWVFEQHKPELDATVVPNSIALALASGANRISQIVCSLESAISSIYYLTDYSTKDGVVLSRILPCLAGAMKHTEKYPSTAEDTRTDFQKTIHVLQQFTNNVTTMEEHTTVFQK